MNLGGQPIFILSDDAQRRQGRDAQENNIAACKAVANAVRTTLGPHGMDKMMVDSIGDLIVTNDGVTILEEMELEHPAAKMMVEVAKTQDQEVGDGTTTSVVIAGELLAKAEDLLEQDVHPTIVAQGYRMAQERALDALHELADDVTSDDADVLQNIAKTTMTGKGAESSKDYLSEIALTAVQQVAEEVDGSYEIDKDLIKIEKKEGSSVDETELVQGVILDKERVHPNMPERVDDANIALLNTPVEVQETETSAEIQISDPNKLQEFIDQEEESLRKMVDQIKEAGANVVLCQKGIDDIAQHFMAKEGIFAIRRVKKSDMEKLAKASGASIVTSIKDLTEDDLGRAGSVAARNVGGSNMTFVQDCENAKSVSILIRGGTEHVVDEVERALEDAIGGISSALRTGRIVGGGGASEVEVARQLRDYAESVGGREQLAINAFADALETIPRTLSENAGLDPIDVLVDLRSKHENGEKWAGIDVTSGKSEDLFQKNVIEPLQIKTQAIQSAAEAAELILRIDDVIASTGSSKGGGEDMPDMGGGMPGGMGGMGGMM